MKKDRAARNDLAISDKHEKMISARVESLICRLALPSITTMLVSALYNMADTYFVSSLGTAPIAGVGVVFPLMAVIQAIGFFFGHGSGNYMSRRLGARDLAAAKQVAACGTASSFAAGCCVCAAGTLFLEPLAGIMGATPTIIPYAMEYMRYILFAAPLMTTSLTLNNLFRFQGSSFYGMVGIASGAMINIILDPIFIFRFGMGVRGAATATLISQAVGFCLLLAGCGRRGNIPLEPAMARPSLKMFKNIIHGGFPSICRQGIASISTICVNRCAGLYGDAAIAALSITMRIMMFATSALLGFGQGFQPVCGFNYGARRYDRVREAFWFCVKFSTAALLVLSSAGIVYADRIIMLFRTDDPQVTALGSLSLTMMCCVFPLSGMFIMTNMFIQTIGYSVRASILALSRQGLFLMPLLFILSAQWGLFGVQLAQPLSDLLASLLSIPLAISALRQIDVADGQTQKEP